MEYNVVVMNLDRRTDRWEICHKTLLSQGVPQEGITRFSAYDGRNYSSLTEAVEVARKQCGGSLPRMLKPVEKDLTIGIGNYCLRWGFFTVLLEISSQSNDELTLVMVDDHQMNYTYREVCDQLERLYNAYGEINIIQYMPQIENTNNVIPETRTVPKVPNLRFGLGGRGDAIILYGPTGAHKFLDVVNNEEKFKDNMQIPMGSSGSLVTLKRIRDRGYLSPLLHAYTHIGDQQGCYSVFQAPGGSHLDVPPGFDMTQDRKT